MENQPATTNDTPQISQSNQPAPKTPRKRPSKRQLLILSVVLLAVIGAGTAYYLQSKTDKPKETAKPVAQEKFPAPPEKPVAHSETVTPTAFGNFLALSLETYWAGGNTNGTNIEGHKYYPSTADVKNVEWAKKNLKIPDQIIDSLQKDTITYVPEGCDADKPSGEQNKCTSFTLKSDNKTIAKSNN